MTLKVLLAISSMLTTDLVSASPVVIPTAASGDYAWTSNHTQLGIHEVPQGSNSTQGLVPNLAVILEDSTTEAHAVDSQFVVDPDKGGNTTLTTTKKPVTYPGIDPIRGNNTSSPISPTFNTTETSSDPKAEGSVVPSQIGDGSHNSRAENMTMTTKRDDVWGQLTGWNNEDPIEDLIRPTPNKPTCFYRDTPGGILSGHYREYYIAVDMPAKEIPSLCGGLWDNLHGNGCSVWPIRPECKAWKGKHYDGLRWYFSTYDSCRLNVPPKVYFAATYGKMGGIKECIPAPLRADGTANEWHPLGSDE